MANSFTVTTLEDGGKYTDANIEFYVDTANYGYTQLMVFSGFYVDPVGNPTTQWRCDQIDFMISDPLVIDLQWDATTPISFARCVGRGRYPAVDYHQPLQNKTTTGKTGNIAFQTYGWTAGILTGSILLKLAKQ